MMPVRSFIARYGNHPGHCDLWGRSGKQLEDDRDIGLRHDPSTSSTDVQSAGGLPGAKVNPPVRDRVLLVNSYAEERRGRMCGCIFRQDARG